MRDRKLKSGRSGTQKKDEGAKEQQMSHNTLLREEIECISNRDITVIEKHTNVEEEGDELVEDVDDCLNGEDGNQVECSNEDLNKSVLPSGSISVKLYKCHTCGKEFSKKPYAKSHCRAKPSWKCDLCGSEIKQASNVKRHKERCTRKLKPAPAPAPTEKQLNVLHCAECGKEFPTAFNLVRHRKAKHNIEQVNQMKCSVEGCNFSTVSGQQMKRHSTMAHTSTSMDVKCSKCEFICFTESGLRKHMRIVHGTECPKCDKFFSSEKKLEVHIMIMHKEVEVTSENSEQIVVSRKIGEHACHKIPIRLLQSTEIHTDENAPVIEA